MPKSSGIALILCALAAMATAVPSHADEAGHRTNMCSRSRIAVSAGFHTGDIGILRSGSGGIELEATGALRLVGGLRVEAGYISWTMNDLGDEKSMSDAKRCGLAASLSYRTRGGYEFGVGVIPDGGRILLRHTFKKDSDKGFFAQINVAKTKVETDLYNFDDTGISVGIAGGYGF